MATRRTKINFAITRFKGFLNAFRKSKRELVGVLIIASLKFSATTEPEVQSIYKGGV